MIIHPELAALRGNDAPQRRDQQALFEALGGWRDMPQWQAIEAELKRFAAGAALDGLPQLSALFAPQAAAAGDLTGQLIATLAQNLAAAPLGQMPMRHFTDDTLSMLMLARHGTASLALQAIDGQGVSRRPAPVSASFTAGENWDCVLGGSAQGRLVTLERAGPEGATLAQADCELRPGEVHYRDSRRTALQFRAVEGTLVTLKLQRRETAGAPTREYRLSDGALVHQAASTSRDSRLELAAALLGRMGRIDSAPVLAAMAEEPGSASLRWQALRECLGLDTALGFAVLCRIAQRPADALAAPAGALRTQLLEAHPQLAPLGKELAACLA